MLNGIFKTLMLTVILQTTFVYINGQVNTSGVFQKGTITEQFRYIEERTRIYEDYRAIREDMFRTLHQNTIDTLKRLQSAITLLRNESEMLKYSKDSLNNVLETTNADLKKITRTKNSIGVLGVDVGKTAYNTTIWSLIAIMIILLITGYISFKQSRLVTLKTKKDIAELKAEFEFYREKVRLEREKTNISHFHEIQKLKKTR